MATCIIAMLRVQGLPATFAAFMTSIAVSFQLVMTSARAAGTAASSANPMTAERSVFMVLSFSRVLRSELESGSGRQKISLKDAARPRPCAHGYAQPPEAARLFRLEP